MKVQGIRRVAAGGSALLAAGAAFATGAAAPAAADHAEQANTGVLNTHNWRICHQVLDVPSGNPSTAVAWGTAIYDSLPEINAAEECTNPNVGVLSANFPETWLGVTQCWLGGVDGADCAYKFVGLNSGVIEATDFPLKEWKVTACHEFGHIGGLGHRFDTTNTCMFGFYDPSIEVNIIIDGHDIDAINATYPR